MSGYYHYSKSNNAVYAEQSGKFPCSICKSHYGFKSNLAVKSVLSSNEWHHSSKYYNIVEYYDFPGTLENIDELEELLPFFKALKRDSKGWQMIINRVYHIIARNLKAANFDSYKAKIKSGFYNNRKRNWVRNHYTMKFEKPKIT